MTPRQRSTTPEEDFGADALSLANAHRHQEAAEYGDAFTLDDEPTAAPAKPRTNRKPDDDLEDVLALANNQAAPGSSDEGPGWSDAAEKTQHREQADHHVFSVVSRNPGPGPETKTWPDAHHTAARAAKPLPPLALPLASATGHILATPLEALTDLPAFDTSAMDGYAVAGPGPWKCHQGQGLLAGAEATTPLEDGAAIRIATGARVPAGATAVLRTEHAKLQDSTLHATPAHDVRQGQDIRPRGQECRSGTELIPAGAEVTPAILGLAAAAGYDELTVTRRPRVEILILGEELLHRGRPRDGRIRDALGPLLAPWISALGADPFVTRRLGDDAELLHEAVATSTADLVITTGGTAAGPVDHVHATLRRLDADLLIDGVAVRPGHPMLLARLPAEASASAHLVGLPGNPLAAVSGLLTLAAPLIRTLRGKAQPTPMRARLAGAARPHPRDTRLVPVAYDAAYDTAFDAPGLIRPLHFSGPAMLRSLATADAMAVLLPSDDAVAEGAVHLLPLPWKREA
ncbi:molybdopterin molybdotransferase MoeA [Streptomyces boninensis]|uniref:molybdopterin molybdotransferase MoeA n=1 Tax=Streptomyces boninensis TaxID=2039455 RepID=UPI003B22777A